MGIHRILAVHLGKPCGRWRTTTMIGSIRQSGETARMIIEGAVNSEVFRLYVREVLLPTLTPGDVLVMDISAHTKMVRRLPCSRKRA